MRTVVSADGTTIAYDRTGHGPPVVVVGGAFNTRATVAAWGRTLADSFTVYAHDRRGRGDSGDTAPYSVDREVADVAAVIRAAGGSAAIFGHSSGGGLALEAAAAGLPLTRLAVYEAPYLATGDADGDADGEGPDLEAELRELAASGPPGAAATHFLSSTGTPPEVLDQLRHSPDWPGMLAVEHTLWYDCAVMGAGPVPTQRFASVRVPALVLAGSHGWEWVRESGRVLAGVLPLGEYRELDGQGHGVSPEGLGPPLLEFFAG